MFILGLEDVESLVAQRLMDSIGIIEHFNVAKDAEAGVFLIP